MKPNSIKHLTNTVRQARCLFSLVLIGLLGASSNAQNAREVAKKVFPSVVLIVMEDEHGQPLSLGSGFFVSEKELVTNFHVIEGASRGYVKIIGQKEKHNIEGVVAVDEAHDLAVLAVVPAAAPSLSLAQSDKIDVGEEVFAVGNPRGLEGTFSQGIVSSVRTIGSDTLLQITAPISPGSSGGPVLNSLAEVVGVAVATFKGGQNLNFAIPSSAVRKLLTKVGKIEPLKSSKKSSPQKSLLDELGGKSVEGVFGEKLTWESKFAVHGRFTFTLRNLLRDSVKNIYCLIVFYNHSGRPIDFVVVNHSGIIPGGLAKRVNSEVDPSVVKLTTDNFGPVPVYAEEPSTRVEYRVLDFQLAE